MVKKFGPPAGGFTAIDDISFSVKEGEILGFLGPNGAGKSTTTYCILGLIIPNSGYVKIFGQDVLKNRSEVLKQVNYASAEYILPWNLSIWENLLVYAKLYCDFYKSRQDYGSGYASGADPKSLKAKRGRS